MAYDSKAPVLVRLFIYTFLVALIIGGYLFFKPQIGVAVFFIIAVLKMLTFELSLLFKSRLAGKILSIFSLVSTFLMGIVLGVLVLITPFSVYSYYFNLASQNYFLPLKESYYVATLFYAIIIYFALVLCAGAIQKNNLTPLTLLLALISGLFLIIYEQPLFFIITIVALLCFAFLTFKKQIINLVSAIIFCGFIAFLSFIMNPEPQGRGIVEKVFFPEVRNFVNQCFPSLPLMLNIPGFSLASDSTQLGGKNVLSPIPVFDVKNPEGNRLYLATEVFDSYNRKSWSQSKKPLEFSSASTLEGDEATGLSRPIQLKVLTEVFPAIPFTFDTVAFELENKLYHVDSVNWTGMMITPGLGKNQKLTLYRHSEYKNKKNVDLKPYLSVPAGLPERVKALAQEWDIPGASSDQILRAIQDFLAINFTYDLNAPVVGDNEDFLDQFLFEKKWGYCTHFATAFTILARLNQIPVRYVSGFLIYFDPGEKSQRVTARTSHAWPEVWTEEKGWQIWEVTRAVNRNYYNGLSPGYLDYLQRFMIDGNEIALNDFTRQQLRDILGIDFAPTEAKKSFEIGTIQPIIGLILVMVLFFILFLLFKKGDVIQKISLFYKQRPWQRYVNKLVKKFPDVPGPEKKGWLIWQEKVESLYSVNFYDFHQTISLIMKAAYTTEPLSEEELKFLKKQSRKRYLYHTK